MSLEKSEAIILKSFNWSESSRTIVFFNRVHGKLALIDKGGRRFKTKRGRPVPFAELELTFYSSEKETSGYLSDVELVRSYSLEKDGVLGRLAYACAACELLNLLLPEQQPQPALYGYTLNYLEKIEEVEKQYLPSLFLAFFLRVMSQLGYHPSLAYCVGCGKEIDLETTKSPFSISPQRGGIACLSCQTPGDYYIPVSPDGLKLLLALQTASLNEAATLPIAYSEASNLLDALEKLLGYQADLKSQLKSLEFLEKLKNSQTLE